MIDKFCEYLTNKIRKETPDIDDEKAEIIMYGLQLIIGELPKIILLFIIGAILGLWWQTLLAFLLILPYKIVSGGFHLKTHLGCFIGTNICYCGNALLSTLYTFQTQEIKYIVFILTWILSIIFITMYAPADTINLPILTKKERRTKKVLSYIFVSINLIIAIIIKNEIVSNILLFGTIIQSLSITRFVYKITKNEYGYENYIKEKALN